MVSIGTPLLKKNDIRQSLISHIHICIKKYPLECNEEQKKFRYKTSLANIFSTEQHSDYLNIIKVCITFSYEAMQLRSVSFRRTLR